MHVKEKKVKKLFARANYTILANEYKKNRNLQFV